MTFEEAAAGHSSGRSIRLRSRCSVVTSLLPQSMSMRGEGQVNLNTSAPHRILAATSPPTRSSRSAERATRRRAATQLRAEDRCWIRGTVENHRVRRRSWRIGIETMGGASYWWLVRSDGGCGRQSDIRDAACRPSPERRRPHQRPVAGSLYCRNNAVESLRSVAPM